MHREYLYREIKFNQMQLKILDKVCKNNKIWFKILII